ncbi:MAG: alanine--tRNA ligase [Bacteroidetes bacterium]|nr:alanine--tRNA ligase [Bacteroidota bacterium]MBL6943130.1 alanine--tRNA ligase [Bacteroidales bacterium]
MKSIDIRKSFLAFFESKQHKIVPSAPMVVKNDPTLMFTNAGMNQFKDLFLGNTPVVNSRVADTQKCLRVSGKHNDLEEVGHDTYHHTMFEMLGNWSFGNPSGISKGYFKKEAIGYAWELFTKVYGIRQDQLYVTVFEGDKQDGLSADTESYNIWKQYLPESRILLGSKKDNFWEMGETGPCGPCSEIHIDIRTSEEREKIPGNELINKDHPEVIEIWNLVFIEFNRLANGKLMPLAAKHVDTGMGFERLAMVLQGVRSNYDTDIFAPIINEIAKLAGISYGQIKESDIAMRVMADHVRAVAFAIADGQLPSNNGAGYVIRRILRRAVRYGFTFLNFEEPVLYKILPVLVEEMGDVFPELKSQSNFISQVIREEEVAFLRTLDHGIKKFDKYIETHPDKKQIDGDFAFELFDTFGFPIDLTQLIAREKGITIDMEGFAKGLNAQKTRSRNAAEIDAGDWITVREQDNPDSYHEDFVGFQLLETITNIKKYRKVVSSKKTSYEVILGTTPFYAESGGQVGDRGTLSSGNETLQVIDTKKENNQIVHIVTSEPQFPESELLAKVDEKKRKLTTANHSATHLMHAALRKVLGGHVEQKGSLVNEDKVRFDFSHFSKMTGSEIKEVERIVNNQIRENISGDIKQDIPMADAQEMGAIALFGEKYGDKVRVVSFNPDFSVELCGGTHVVSTGNIGFFKILSESGIAAGVRRIEAVTGEKAEGHVYNQVETLNSIKDLFKNQPDTLLAVNNVIDQRHRLEKEIKNIQKKQALQTADSLINSAEVISDIKFVSSKTNLEFNQAKSLAQKIRSSGENIVTILSTQNNEKINLIISISDKLVASHGLNAGDIVKEISHYISGSGGGQPFLATAGGKDASGIEAAFDAARTLIK